MPDLQDVYGTRVRLQADPHAPGHLAIVIGGTESCFLTREQWALLVSHGDAELGIFTEEVNRG